MKISRSISVWFAGILLSALFLSVGSALIYQKEYVKVEKSAEELSKTYATLTKNIIDHFALMMDYSIKHWSLNKEEAARLLYHEKGANPLIMDMLILSPEGDIVAWSGEGVPPYVKDREYYTYHLEAGSNDTYVSPPRESRVHKRRHFFALSKAYRDDKGKLLMIGVVIVDVGRLQNSFMPYVSDKKAGMALLYSDGSYIFRVPDMGDEVGSKIPALKEVGLPLGGGVTFFYDRCRDGKTRLFSLTPIKNYELLAVGCIECDASFGAWVTYNITATIGWMIVAIIGWIIARKIDKIKQRESEASFDLIKTINIKNDLQKALEDSNDRLKERGLFLEALLDNAPVPIFYKDKNGVYLGCNKLFLEELGRESKDEIVGKTAYELAPKDLAKTYKEQDEKVFSLVENPQIYEFSLVRKGVKESRNVVFYKSAFFDKSGEVAGLIGAILDITERKKAEYLLGEEKRFAEEVINSLPGIFYMIDEERNVTRWNPKFCEVLGYSNDEIIGKKAIEFIARDDRDAVGAKMDRVFRDGHGDIEAGLLSKDGTIIPYFFLGHRIVHGGKRYIVGLGSDISIQKQNEERLHHLNIRLSEKVEEESASRIKSEYLYQAIFDRSPEGVLISDSLGVFKKCNKAAADMLGYTIEELQGKSFLETSPEIQSETGLFSDVMGYEIIKRVFEGKIEHFEWEAVHKEGSKVMLEVVVSSFGEKNNELLVMWRDTTEITRLKNDKKLQETLLIQQTKLAEVGEMIAAIAHQWKQPLSNIYMITDALCDIAEDGELDKETAMGKSELIKRQAEFMNQTINDFRNFLKPSREKVVFSPSDALAEVMRLFKDQFVKNNIEIYISEHDGFETIGYPNELKQVFLNILKNSQDAFEDIQEGEKRIEIVLFIDGSSGRIKICDNAGGIPASMLPQKLFDSYVTTKGERGTGIGLQITKKIITEHFSGDITAYNTQVGACFNITLPIYKGDKA